MAGVRGKEGELFGIANLLRLNDSVVTNGTARPIPPPPATQRVTALSVCVGSDIIERAEKLEQSVGPEDSEHTKLNFRIEKRRSSARPTGALSPASLLCFGSCSQPTQRLST
jgi:hypothetical protein